MHLNSLLQVCQKVTAGDGGGPNPIEIPLPKLIPGPIAIAILFPCYIEC